MKKTARRAVKDAPHRWQKGRNWRRRVSLAPLSESGSTRHGNCRIANCADERRDNEVDGSIGAETAGERDEEVEEADDAFNADQEREGLQAD